MAAQAAGGPDLKAAQCIPLATEPAGGGPRTLSHTALEGIVSLWWAPVPLPADELPAALALLSPAEHQRASRYGPQALRDRYTSGRATLRRLLAAHLGLEPARVPIVRGPRGRPALTLDQAIDFNVTHTRNVAVFAIGHRPAAAIRIGVDVEHAGRSLGFDRLARKLLTGEERAALTALDEDSRRRRFLETWTCKEAMSKATGDGLSAPFSRFAVDPGAMPAVIAGPPPYEPSAWRLHRVAMPDDFLLTVALWLR